MGEKGVRQKKMAALPYKFLLATAREGRTTKDKSFQV